MNLPHNFETDPEQIVIAALKLRRETQGQLARASIVALGGVAMISFNIYISRFYNTWMWLLVAFFGGTLFEQLHQCWMLVRTINHCDGFIDNAIYTMQKEGLLTEQIPPWRIRQSMVRNLSRGTKVELFDPFLPKPGEFN